MDIDSVKLKVSRAREIFESFGADIDPVFFRGFPSGCCGNASDILARWLSRQGITGLEYVSGTRGNTSHGWLELDGLIIDITSDQFSDGCGAVFIGDNSKFHESFKKKKLEIHMSSILDSAYSKFTNHMESN